MLTKEEQGYLDEIETEISKDKLMSEEIFWFMNNGDLLELNNMLRQIGGY